MNNPPIASAKPRPDTVHSLCPGSIVGGRYRLREVVATGGFSTVYRAEDDASGRIVAVKVLSGAGAESASRFELVASRMRLEAYVGKACLHPNVVRVFDFGVTEGGGRFLVTEFVDGRTLKDLIAEGPMKAERALPLARQLLEALRGCHARGVVHRDLKPGNIMVDEARGDALKLIDFGLAQVPARLVDECEAGELPAPEEDIEATTMDELVFGTVAYMAPETAGGMRAVDPRSDLYAVGVVLYEMLAGKKPFDAEDPVALFLEHRKAPVPPIAKRAPGVIVPSALEAVIVRLLAKAPSQRYQSADEVLGALRDAERAPTLRPPPRPSQRSLESVASSVAPVALAIPVAASSEPGAADGTPIVTPRRPSFGWRDLPRVRPVAILSAMRRRRFATAVIVAALAAAAMFGLGEDDKSHAAPARPPKDVADGPSVPAAPAAPEVDDVAIGEARKRFVQGAENRRWLTASQALVAWLAVDPNALADAADRDLAVTVARRAAQQDAPKALPLFDALATFGEPGLAVLYRIVEAHGGSRGADLAWERLARADLRDTMSPELAVAVGLRSASCADKPALFEHAAALGDDRALRVLNLLRSRRCDAGRGECCYQADKSLDRAARAIKARTSAPAIDAP